MKLFKIVLLFFIHTLIYSCNSGAGGCEMMFSNAKYLGNISLNIESKNWIPEPGLDSILFVNSNGTKNFFVISKYENTNYQYDLYINQSMSNETCTQKDYNYITGNRESYTLKSDEVPFYIDVNRQLNIKERLMNDTLSIQDLTRLSDKISYRIAYSISDFILKDSLNYNKSDRILLDSLYKDVYELPCVADLSYGYPLKFMYVQRGKGLIGFQFSNNEIWARKNY